MKNLLKILCVFIFFTSCEENVVEAIHGCFDSEACNYNPDATYDNNSCEYQSCADCTGVPFGDAEEDDCGICLGDGTYCLPINITFGNIYINDEQQVNVEILIDNPQNLNGFQFYLNESETQILSADGGLCDEYGFDVIVNPNSQAPNLIIGFSFTGDIIPSGSNGILTNLTLTSPNIDLCFELGNGSFTKSVDPSNELEQLYDELDGTNDDVIEYSVNFGNCITIPTLN